MLKELENYTSLVDVWRNSAENYADRTAFIYSSEEYSFYEVDLMINSFAKVMKEEFRIGAGDRVAIVLPNSIPFVVAYFACQMIRAVPVPLNTRLRGKQFDKLFSHLRPCALITSKAQQQVLEPLLEAHRYIRCRFGVEISDPDWDCFEVMSSDSIEYLDFDPPRQDDVGLLLFTSGTTGTPKGAVFMQSDLLHNIAVSCNVFNFSPEDVNLLSVPLFHCTGIESILPSSVYMGATCILDEQINPSHICEIVPKYGITTFITVPTVLNLLIAFSKLAPKKLASLRLIGFSGSPIHSGTVNRLTALLPNTELVNFYGLTETTSIITANRGKMLLENPDPIGVPLEGVSVTIVGDEGKCAAGETGELRIGREHIIPCYYGMNRIEAQVEDGYFRTGDLAVQNDDGCIYLRGRNDDIIIVGGENVFAPEVEDVLNSHPSVMEAAVIGVPNRIFGEVVKAFIVPKQSKAVNALSLKKFCYDRLPSYKVPMHIELMTELPRSMSGKVLKGYLKKR